MMQKDVIYDTIIIGAGIAGMTAAMYAARKRMRFEMISPDVGGQFMASGEILNYPGIIRTTGAEFSSVMEKQMEFNGVKQKAETVKEVKKQKGSFLVSTDRGSYTTRTIIIATGARPRKLGVPGEDRLANRGVAYCSVCDGPIFAGKEVAVIGGGNAALEAVDFMKDIAKRIYLVVLGSRLEGHEYLIERVKSNPKVEILLNARTTEITGDKFVSGVRYEQKGMKKSLAIRGVIIEIGRIPNTELFRGLVKLDEHNHIEIDCQTETSVPGIFAAGDCASSHEYQYIIAAGQGCMALIKAARYIAKLKP
jgi:thioredoxin-disulfide reductase